MDKILGVKIDNLTRREILKKIEGFLSEPKFHQIVTVNPEFILEAQKNSEFREIINNSNLSVADGFGVSCAFFYNLKKLKCRLTGVDLLVEILKIAEKMGLSVFLACRRDGLTSFQEAKEAIFKKYPKLFIEGREITPPQSSPLERGGGSVFGNSQILICNFGAPKQETFIRSVKNDRIRLAIGVGGALDFFSGKLPRAPIFMRKMGLEWLWRFLQEPKYRFRRILRAVVVFPIRVLFNK